MAELPKNSVQRTPTDKESGDAIAPKRDISWVEIAIMLLFACCMAFVILTPQDALQRYPQVVPYVDWMASWNPHVYRLGLKNVSGSWADANRFCAAVMWGVWTPLLVPLLVVMFKRDEPVKPFASMRGVLFALIAGPLLAYVSIYGTGGIDSRLGRFMVANLLGRSFFISVAAGVFWVSIYATFVMWRNAFRRNFDF